MVGLDRGEVGVLAFTLGGGFLALLLVFVLVSISQGQRGPDTVDVFGCLAHQRSRFSLHGHRTSTDRKVKTRLKW